MTSSFEVVSPLVYPRWDELLATNGSSSFFHTSGWARVLAETYGYEPRYFLTINGGLSSLIPTMDIRSLLTGNRGVSLPFSDYSPLILDRESEPRQAFEVVARYGKSVGWDYLEIRDDSIFSEDVPPFMTYFGHTLRLSADEDAVLSRFRGSTARNIKKAARDGVIVERSESMDTVDDFYRLHCITRKDKGVPPQPHAFFKMIHDQIISRGKGFVVLARYEKRRVAGAIFFHFGSQAYFKFGASDKKFQHLRANNLVMWEAIKWYCRNGYGSLCLGRTGAKDDGLRRYKSGWGTTERTIRYFRYDIRKDAFIRGGSRNWLENRVLRRMPLAVLRSAGELLYRHVG